MQNPASDYPRSSPHMVERLVALSSVAKKLPVQGKMRLTSLSEGLVAHVMGFNTSQQALSHLTKLAEEKNLFLRNTSVDQWFLVGDHPYTAIEFEALATSLQPDFALSDQSAGRVRLQITGDDVAFILNKGIALDLSLASFPIGKATPTLCGHIGVHLTRQDANQFELIVLRSFAVDLWEQLAHMCGE